jgi:hypothetical protein
MKIKVNGGTTSTGKKIKVFQDKLEVDDQGQPISLRYLVKVFETDEVTAADQSDLSEVERFQERMKVYDFRSKSIDPGTMVLVPPNTDGAVVLQEFLALAQMNKATLAQTNDSLLALIVQFFQANNILPS